MEAKKTDKANVQRSSMTYFLVGLNVVLLLVLLLFNYKQYETPPEKVEEVAEAAPVTEAVIIDIPLPKTPPPPPKPDDAPPPPPPPVVPTIIEETPKPVPPPPIKAQEPTPPEIPTAAVSTGPVKKVDLSGLTKKVNENRTEERVVAVTVNRVAEMAVYPGCEKFKGDKRQLIKCFGDELGKDILRYLDTEFPDINKESVGVRLEFHVDQNGYITNIDPKYGDEIFKPEAKRAMEKAAEYLRRKGQVIEPAKMSDGKKAVLIFTQDVRLKNPNY